MRESRSRKQRASTAGIGMRSASYSRASVPDSGVFSPTVPVARTEFPTRTSTSSSNSNADYRRSMTLEGLKNEVMDV